MDGQNYNSKDHASIAASHCKKYMTTVHFIVTFSNTFYDSVTAQYL